MCDRQSSVTITVPPVQLYNAVEAEVGNKIKNMMWNDYRGGHAIAAFCVLHNRPQRWPVKVVEVGMCDQDQINWGQVAYLQTRLSKTFQDKQPARKVRINDNVLAADLEEETGVADESHTQLAIGYQPRLMSTTSPGSYHRVAHQRTELPGTLAERGILERIL